jgi:TPR repeat protein
MSSGKRGRAGLVGRVLARLDPRRPSPAARLAAARDLLAADRAGEAARLLAGAPADDGEARFELGRLYETGRGVLRDLADAAACYEDAAAQGHAEAMTRLAVLLVTGGATGEATPIAALHPNGATVARAPERARALACAAAEAGNVEARTLAGYLHAAGIGGPVDMAAALAHYEPAARAGNVEAALGLGTLLAGGHVGAADAAAARPWFEKAAAAGNATARTSLAIDLLRGLGGEADPARARDLLEAAAASGHAPASRILGLTLLDGHLGPPDAAAGERHLRGAAARGDVEAIHRLAELVRARAPAEARSLHRRAADRDHVASMRRLADMLRRGEGGERDPEGAIRWLEAAAEHGDRDAQFALGVAHAVGDGVPFDLAKAAAWSQRAAEAGHSAAKVNIGRFQMQGTGTTRDPASALRWLGSAFDDGELAAVVALGELFAFWADPPDRPRARALFERAVQLGDLRARDLLRRLDETDAEAASRDRA